MRLLDTSVIAKWGDPTHKDEVLPYLQSHATDRFVTSSLVVYELFRPAKRRSHVRQVRDWLDSALDSIEPFTDAAGIEAAEVEDSLESIGQPLQFRDLLTAAHARNLGATFVTCDKADFRRTPLQQLFDVDVIGG